MQECLGLPREMKQGLGGWVQEDGKDGIVKVEHGKEGSQGGDGEECDGKEGTMVWLICWRS